MTHEPVCGELPVKRPHTGQDPWRGTGVERARMTIETSNATRVAASTRLGLYAPLPIQGQLATQKQNLRLQRLARAKNQPTTMDQIPLERQWITRQLVVIRP